MLEYNRIYIKPVITLFSSKKLQGIILNSFGSCRLVVSTSLFHLICMETIMTSMSGGWNLQQPTGFDLGKGVLVRLFVTNGLCISTIIKFKKLIVLMQKVS